MSITSSPRETVGIREVSERTGLSLDTLRWYEREGLLAHVGRRSDGRRQYSEVAIGFVRLVQVLRRTGMPVAEVRAFVQLGWGELEQHAARVVLLERHAAAVEEQRERLRADQATIQGEIAHYRDLITRGLDCKDDLEHENATAEEHRGSPR
jgi:DNA-binding transcriptional MerR regulator